MKKLLRHLLLALTLTILNSLFITPKLVIAVSVPPFPPFSIEGNPDEDYIFSEIFPLFRYIPAPSLEVYENADRNRTYEPYIMCPGAGADRRDYYCDNSDSEESGCDGGEVDICEKNSQAFAYVTTSGSTGCKLPKPDPNYPDAFLVGKCEYKQSPKITHKIKGTDFSEGETLAFSKIQSESLSYNNIGSDNVITWGSEHLSNELDYKIINQLMVLSRAKQTKNTHAETGEWPLGWVDWGYATANGKTLIDIQAELPGNVSSAGMVIIEADDDFFLTGGNLEIISDVSKEKKDVIDTVNRAALQNPQPEWVKDFLQSPMYSPSFRRGYVRPSICIWDKCCPTTRCPVPQELLTGQKRGLYYDVSVSQAYGAAMNDLFKTNSLSEGMRLFKKLLETNPLARYLTSAAPKATPSRINEELNELLKGTCYDYVPWGNWLGFGTHIDYAKPGEFLDPNKRCPDYDIMPIAVKETAAARAPSLADILVSLFWGQKVDDVEPRKDHLITIPDAMGQSVEDIQDPVYDTYESLSELDKVREYNQKMSNIVDDEADYLYSGKISGPNRAKRFTSLYYGCSDEMYSAQTLTNIEIYATGGRKGCYETTEVAEASINCDPNVPEQNVSGLSVAAGKDYTDRLFAGCTGNSQWMQCHNDVIKRASASGVDPLFALAIWVHESGASNYECGEIFTQGVKIQDFGINITDIAENFTEQISKFLALPSSYEYCGKTMGNFIAKFWFAKCESELSPSQKIRVGDYIAELNFIYSVIAPTRSLPGYPQIGPYVPSNPSPTISPSTPTPSPSASIIPGTGNPPSGFFPQNCGSESLSTALGCIPYTRDAFISALLTFIVGIAGAIALVIMLVATFQIMTAGGNPEQLKKGRELFTSAVVGLLFLIFSVSMLNLVAGDIIKLPGFQRP